MRYKNIAGRFFGLVTKHDGQTDRHTDRQNYDSQDRASIAASRGKNVRNILVTSLCPSQGCCASVVCPQVVKFNVSH